MTRIRSRRRPIGVDQFRLAAAGPSQIPRYSAVDVILKSSQLGILAWKNARIKPIKLSLIGAERGTIKHFLGFKVKPAARSAR
eukprot:1499111-Karenia_brevis.AAC.1